MTKRQEKHGGTPDSQHAEDSSWLARAIELSRNCPRTERSFAVGAVIIDADGRELATGFSLEFGFGWHAEEAAIHKAREDGCKLEDSTLYCTIEPCSTRLSGKTSCVAHILDARIRRVVFAWQEPLIFVDCHGEEQLRQHGIDVSSVPALSAQVREVNRHVLEFAGWPDPRNSRSRDA